ncbi:MAG: hypothetical protein E7K04_05125 [Helicobacter sp.]|nr:hypothetical protein [Helicobacter sp.]
MNKQHLLYLSYALGTRFFTPSKKPDPMLITIYTNANDKKRQMLDKITQNIFNLSPNQVLEICVDQKFELAKISGLKNKMMLIFDSALCGLFELKNTVGVVQNYNTNKALATYSLEMLENNVDLKKIALNHFKALQNAR